MSRRTERVGFTLQRELGKMIDEDLSDPRLAKMTSITRVECTGDLASAHVYVSVLGEKEALDGSLEALQSAAGYLRREVGKRIHIRHVPRLVFHLDPALAEAADMFKMMDEVAKDDSKRPKIKPPENEPGANGSGAADDDADSRESQ